MKACAVARNRDINPNATNARSLTPRGLAHGPLGKGRLGTSAQGSQADGDSELGSDRDLGFCATSSEHKEADARATGSPKR